MNIKFWTLSFRIFHQFTSSIPNESQKTSFFFAKHRLCLTETHPDLPPSLQATFVTWMVDFVSFLDLGFFWDLQASRWNFHPNKNPGPGISQTGPFFWDGDIQSITGWWQLKYFFMFTPKIWVRFPILANIFQRGWNHQLDQQEILQVICQYAIPVKERKFDSRNCWKSSKIHTTL